MEFWIMAIHKGAVSHRPHGRRARRSAPRAGASTYERGRNLPRLQPVTEGELAPDDTRTARTIVARLARALRAERQRGRAGHWSYDLNRHIALAQALDAERRRLEGLNRPSLRR
jgi:hypothetical protein